MPLSPFASPRRLALLAIGVFILFVLVLQSSSYKEELPRPRVPKFSSNYDSGKSSSPQQEESKVEWPGQGSQQASDDEAHYVPGYGLQDSSEASHVRVSTSSVLASEVASSSTLVLTSVKNSSSSTTLSSSSAALSSSSTALSTSTNLAATRTRLKHSFSTFSHTPYQTIQSKVQDLLAEWTPPPNPRHWPPYQYYQNQDYDPNMWEGFQWDNDFYINNGIKKLKKGKKAAATPVPYLPYPKWNSNEWKREWKGKYVPCEGPRRKLLNESSEDWLKAYPAVLDSFPQVVVGDANATGIDIDHCFDRYNRYGPYGYGDDETGKVKDWKRPANRPDWQYVDWGQLQDRCLAANRDRYSAFSRQPFKSVPGKGVPKENAALPQGDGLQTLSKPRHHHRTAVLIRTWEGYRYTDNDIEAIRSLVTELSLLSGGEYQVFLLVNIKDWRTDILANEKIYQDLLKEHVPPELENMAVLWNEKAMEDTYPKIGDWQVYWHQFMPLQWFSKKHPQFDYIWNWETDARYTGNHYHFLEKVSEFAKKQPRKYLWERNARFYFPAAHGTYQQWTEDTNGLIQAAIQNGTMDPVWGPQPYNDTWQHPIGPKPPRSQDTDDFEWGVDEEADLVTLQPIWDPTYTEWTFRDKIWNYLPGVRPHFSVKSPMDDQYGHPEFKNIPRRTYINTLSRFSRRQLHAMHLENLAGRTMQAEMWPATVALQHGLKAVYAPHPIWADRRWPAWYMDAVFNADGGETARWGQRADSVYNHDREHNFAGWSWYFSSDFPRVLFRRWLGWSATVGSELQYPNNGLRVLGGPKFEEKGVKVELEGKKPDGSQAAPGGWSWAFRNPKVGGNGRMCLPPMLLHPVKNTNEDADTEQSTWGR